MFLRNVHVREDNKIEGRKTSATTTYKRFSEPLAIRVGSVLLNSIGITKYKIINIPLGAFVGLGYIIIIAHTTVTINSSVITYKTMTYAQIFVDLISWFFTFKTNTRIYSFSQSLLKLDRVTSCSYISPYTIASMFLVPSLHYFFVNLYTFLTNGKLNIKYIIDAVFPGYNDQCIGVLVIADVAFFHMRYGAVFFVAFQYSLNCILIYERTATIFKKSIAADPEEALKTCRRQLLRVKALEDMFCVPIFFVFVRVSLQILNAILYISAFKKSISKIGFAVLVAQYSGMFLLIVLTADAVQIRCRSNVETVFSCTRKFENVGIRLGYLDYMKLDGWNRLTAWKVVSINRNLLLTAIASVVTYGALISQVQSPDD